ncbi:ABC transporter substrate-binding protein [Scleromatobacter humisilvae]|uniref:NrtA/SsuA/CpmA family ABC transporter substrate-binding protein n=1 Tax=Scleromatobacter humisilvae TaxID=2897159 RepID=A0A9X1YP12_9BURK|nr:NrtA/SsuA/CpmA family ABC transporter substrate-binding protein [Scleromatobacter humisilvae]MCK9685116.1 NrtA/SsuA/CpmA family ABC transporter substrate-binding protein [Scleromatobacter humisilvae]
MIRTPSATAPRRRAARWRAAVALATSAWLAPAGAADTLRIAASRAPVSLPLYVAQQRGFFADERLEVAITDCIGGTRCLRQLLDDQADLATTSEMPVVLHAFAQPDVAIVATIAHASDNLKLIARKAGGVRTSEQLTGRKVGVTAGTAAQYLLETHLLDVGVDPQHVTMVPLQAEDTVAALRSGRIDAVAVWEPFGYAALHGDDAVGVRLPLGGGYIESYNLVARRALFSRDDELVRLLRAVERAEQFIQARPAEAQAILREQLKLDQHFVDWVWGGLGFRLSLDQALVSTMEGEIRWAQREGHVAAGARPNVLTLIHAGPLKTVKPAAVGTGS